MRILLTDATGPDRPRAGQRPGGPRRRPRLPRARPGSGAPAGALGALARGAKVDSDVERIFDYRSRQIDTRFGG
jgi:hypothetical protein